MEKKNNYNQCKIVVSGSELVELKRHGHEIPECPGLDIRIQKYSGEKPFTLTYEELGWLYCLRLSFPVFKRVECESFQLAVFAIQADISSAFGKSSYTPT